MLCASAALACASDPGAGPGADGPDVRLRALLEEWYAARDAQGSCASGGRSAPYVDCGRIQAAIERLSLEFPAHAPVLIANAVVAFDSHRPDKAQSYLDSLLELEPVQPQAAVLRSRLAIQQGNLPYARRLLEEQVHLAPDDSGLREALASTQYLGGAFDSARRELRIAERLGAPSWRVAYHRGLVDEAEGLTEAAIANYRRALEEKPGWERARSRLRGLESARGLQQGSDKGWRDDPW